MKSGNFNFLEPSVLLQACNGTHLPLPLRTNLFSWYNQHAECFVSETRNFRRISSLPPCRITDFSNMRSRTLINFTNNNNSGYILLGYDSASRDFSFPGTSKKRNIFAFNLRLFATDPWQDGGNSLLGMSVFVFPVTGESCRRITAPSATPLRQPQNEQQ
jgi:hypothetical protein